MPWVGNFNWKLENQLFGIYHIWSIFFGGGLEVEGVDVQIIMVMYLLEYVLVCVVLFGGLGPVDECVL